MISEIISDEVGRFKTETVETTDGVYFSQYNNVQRIDRYRASKFLNNCGDDAIFWNIGTPRSPLFAKSIDAQSKNFKMIGKGEFDFFPVFALNARFRNWVKDSGFAMTLDKTAYITSDYGSSVWKRVKRNKRVIIEAVNLSNLYFDPTVENIIETPVIELHYLSEHQIRAKFPKDAARILENAKRTRDDQDNQSETTVYQYEIWERWGAYVDEKEVYKYMHFVGAGYGDGQVVMVEDEIKLDDEGTPIDFPYYDFHIGHYNKRWQRVGVYERLFILQERMNTIINQNAEATQIASLLLMRTEDANTHGNVLQSAVSGQIINSADLTQIGMDNRAAGTILNEMQGIENQADALCFITESVSGETPPSGVPFRSVAVAANASKSTFDFTKQSMIEKMALILQKEILPLEVKNWKLEDVFDIAESEDDIKIYDQLLLKKEQQKLLKANKKAGIATAEEDLLEVEDKVRKSLETNARRIEITKDLFDFEWGVDMNPTGEGLDKNAINSATDAAIADMLSNPNVVNTPIYKYKLSLNGIPPFRLNAQEIQELQPQGQPKVAPAKPKEDKLSALVLE